MNAKVVVCGFDFRLGAGGGSDAEERNVYAVSTA